MIRPNNSTKSMEHYVKPRIQKYMKRESLNMVDFQWVLNKIFAPVTKWICSIWMWFCTLTNRIARIMYLSADRLWWYGILIGAYRCHRLRWKLCDRPSAHHFEFKIWGAWGHRQIGWWYNCTLILMYIWIYSNGMFLVNELKMTNLLCIWFSD